MTLYRAAHAALKLLLWKEDVPDVEAAKRIVEPLVRRHWDLAVKTAVLEVLGRLERMEDRLPTNEVDAVALQRSDPDRDDLIAALVLSLFLVIERNLKVPIPFRKAALVRDAINGLLLDGGKSVGSIFPLSSTRGVQLPGAVEDDLHLMLHGRLITRRREIENILRRMITEKPQRRAALKSGEPDELTTKLTEILDGRKWQSAAMDQWAYRAFALGAALSAIEAGAGTLYVWNPRDDRTTPFCRWVHGRVIAVGDAKRQIDRYLVAASSGSAQTLMDVWPLVSFPNGTPEAKFGTHFRITVLPPYHNGCRSLVKTTPPVL